jgi:hypothetical protein
MYSSSAWQTVHTQVSAQTGRESVDDRLQLVMEFWMMALHITVVVNRA